MIYNVMNPPYNAVGDGVADDSGPINHAASDAAAAGGGIVYCPTPSVGYRITTAILLGSNTTLEGDNTGSTKILAGVLMTHGKNTIMVANSDYNQAPFTQLVQQYITVRNLTFWGNAAANVSTALNQGAALNFAGAGHVTIENCYVYDVFNHAISVVFNDNVSSVAQDGFIRIRNNIVDVMPIRQTNVGDMNRYDLVSGNLSIRVVSLNEVLIDGNMIGFGNTTWANDAIDTPGCSRVTITNNMITWSTDGMGTEQDSDYTIRGNLISNCIGYPIRSFQNSSHQAATDRMVIADNVIVGVPPGDINLTLGPTLVGIHVDQGGPGNNTDCIISNNVLFGPFDAAAINLGAVQGTCVGNMIDLQGRDYGSTGITIGNDNWVVCNNTIRFGTTGIAIPAIQKFLTISGNNLKDLTTFVSTPLGLPTNSKISQNTGYNPPAYNVISQPTIGTTVQTNNFPFDCTVYIWGGAGIQVAVDSAPAMATGTPISVRVPAGGTIKLSYTSVPTWYWIAE